jgi:hypothetical protein
MAVHCHQLARTGFYQQYFLRQSISVSGTSSSPSQTEQLTGYLNFMNKILRLKFSLV